MELTEGHWNYIRHEANQRYQAALLRNKDLTAPKVDNSPKDTDSEIEKAIKNEVVKIAFDDVTQIINFTKIKLEFLKLVQDFEQVLDRAIAEKNSNEDEDPSDCN